MGLKRFVGKYVVTNQRIPFYQRGENIPAGSTLFTKEIVNDKYFNLVWPGGLRAANEVHYSKLIFY